MNVTMIGSGNMAHGIGTRLVSGGNAVTIHDREPETTVELVQALKQAAVQGATVQTVPLGSPLPDEVVILAVPYPAIASVIEQYRPQLAGKIVVDISNPLTASYTELATPPGTSSAEETAQLVPAGTRVVKAFNTTFARTLVAGQVAGQRLDVFLAGDDAAAKGTIAQLVEAGGLRAIDVGPLQRARQLEGLGFLGITLQSSLGTQFTTAWKLLP